MNLAEQVISESKKALRKVRALDKKLKGTVGIIRRNLLNKRSNAILQYIRTLKELV